uniref:Uncharacterized protein n=1 Tax=Cacopsylla melanoneura TaxID=428564 RepID=A0A8D8QBY9_9HEMI
MFKHNNSNHTNQTTKHKQEKYLGKQVASEFDVLMNMNICLVRIKIIVKRAPGYFSFQQIFFIKTSLCLKRSFLFGGLFILVSFPWLDIPRHYSGNFLTFFSML